MNNLTEDLPHAPIAEKSILSVMMAEPSRIARAAAEGIDASAFYRPAHRIILEAIAAAKIAGHVNADGSVNISCIVQQAALDGMLDRMGGAAEIADIHNYAYSASGWSAWCEQLRECKARRIAIQAAHAIADASDSEEAIQAATAALDGMRRAITAKTRSLPAKDACADFLRRYLATGEGRELPGVSTGIGEIDGITGGMKPGELWVIGGPSSSGKSALMYQVAQEFLGQDRVLAIFSAELMAHEIVGRLVTLKARVPYVAITDPHSATKQDIAKIRPAIDDMISTRMWIDASGGQSIDTIEGECERIRDIEGRIDLVIVDYLQIIRGRRNKGDSREQEIASISGGLKQLAKTMGCPVITGTQLNDDGKTRESRAIEQDADVWLVISDGGLKMAKVRNGPRGATLPLALDGGAQRFRYFRND